MPMPKGARFEGGYVTLRGRDPMGFGDIARVMTQRGHPMRQSTARGHLMSAVRKLARGVLVAVVGEDAATDEEVARLVAHEDFHQFVGEVLDEDAYGRCR